MAGPNLNHENSRVVLFGVRLGLEKGTEGAEKVGFDLLGRRDKAVPGPPLDGSDKSGRDVVQKEAAVYLGCGALGVLRDAAIGAGDNGVAQAIGKELGTLARNQGAHALAAIPQVVQGMAYLDFGPQVGAVVQGMGAKVLDRGSKNVGLAAKLRVERCTCDAGSVQKVLHGDPAVVFLGDELVKRSDDSGATALFAGVH